MEDEETFDVESLFSGGPVDVGLHPLPPPLPLHPSHSHMNKRDVAQSSADAGSKLEQDLELPYFTCTPTDVELVQDYLRPASLRLAGEYSHAALMRFGPALVNAELPTMDPWELPGLARNNGGMRDKYYLTDHRDLVFHTTNCSQVRTPNGFWKKQTSDTAISAGHDRHVGIKRTMKFSPYRGVDPMPLSGANTSWIINIYFSTNRFVEDGLVLCHVFETDSPDYNDKCLGCHPGAGAHNGNHCGQEFRAPSNASFSSTHPGPRPMHHHDTERRSDPKLNSYIAEFENILLGDPDPDNFEDTGNSSPRSGVPPTADHGHSKKRKKSSDVWDYFTKIFARGIDGKVLTFAACDHCCKMLTASSTGGTTHLARHTCPCKFKPVAAGRGARDSGGDVNVLSS